MGMVGVVIGIVISLVVGVALIPVITSQSNALTTLGDNPSPQAVVSLGQLLPVIFIAVVIIGAVGFLARKNQM